MKEAKSWLYREGEWRQWAAPRRPVFLGPDPGWVLHLLCLCSVFSSWRQKTDQVAVNKNHCSKYWGQTSHTIQVKTVCSVSLASWEAMSTVQSRRQALSPGESPPGQEPCHGSYPQTPGSQGGRNRGMETCHKALVATWLKAATGIFREKRKKTGQQGSSPPDQTCGRSNWWNTWHS